MLGRPAITTKIGGLKPRGDIVEIVKACGNSRDMFFSLREFIDEIQTFLDDLNDRA